MSEQYPDLIELAKKSPRDLMVITVTKLNAIEGKSLPAIDDRLKDINGTVKAHDSRLTVMETKCHETRTTVFARLDRISFGDGSRLPKKFIASGIGVIVVLGSLLYAAGCINGWW